MKVMDTNKKHSEKKTEHFEISQPLKDSKKTSAYSGGRLPRNIAETHRETVDTVCENIYENANLMYDSESEIPAEKSMRAYKKKKIEANNFIDYTNFNLVPLGNGLFKMVNKNNDYSQEKNKNDTRISSNKGKNNKTLQGSKSNLDCAISITNVANSDTYRNPFVLEKIIYKHFPCETMPMF